jgi:hypothetical protein
MEYIGVIAAVVVVVGMVAALLVSPSLRSQVSERTQALVDCVVGEPGCERTSGESGGGSSGDDTSGDEGSGDGDEGCSGFWGCAWSGVQQVGSGVYNIGKGAVDDVVGIVDLVRNPGSLIDAARYIWDNPGDALRQLVWDDESAGMWGSGDYGGAIGRTIWNVGSWFIPGVNIAKGAGKFGKLGKLARIVDDLADLGRLADDAAAAARRAKDLAARGDLEGAARAAREAREKADEAAEQARKAGCPIAARLPGQDANSFVLAVSGETGGGPVLSLAVVPVVLDRLRAAGPDCDDAQAAAREADEAADEAEAVADAVAVNRAGMPYPEVIDPRTGEPIHFPGEGLQKVPVSERVTWGAQERGAFIKEWYDRGYPTPEGGWSGYDIHHIQPREYGGTNDFDNLVPVPRDVHQQQFNPWWREY